jgi:hypothetical protein
MDVEKLILLVKAHQAIYDPSRSEHRNRDHIASVWVKIAEEMGGGKRKIVYYYYYYYYYALC